jgi:DNA (cytosine-5)-methyltransferase 1
MQDKTTTKVLNLYAGIGGNRREWENVDVTAIEWDQEKADIYEDFYPQDTVIVDDAHQYLEENHHDFDFIWSSPPCPTHSEVRYIHTGENKQNDAKFPDMRLYEEILFLQGYFDGDYVVENVNGWYDPLIEPLERQRHYFWSNFFIPSIDLNASCISSGTIQEWQDNLGFDLSDYDIDRLKKRKILRNCVKPKLGKHVFESTSTPQQSKLF